MSKSAKVLFCLSGLFFIISLLLAIYCIYSAFSKNIVFEGELVQASTVLENIPVNLSRQIMLSLEMDIETPTTEYNVHAEHANNYKGLFNIPINYVVKDSSGRILYQADEEITQNSRKENGYKSATSEIGKIGGEFVLDKIKITSSPINVSIHIGTDKRFAAKAKNIKLRLYDNVLPYTPYVIAAVVLLLFSLIALITAAVVMLAGGKKIGYISIAITEEDIIQNSGLAAAAHLSALSGFIIPFGGFLGPLVVWLVGRDKSKFVDDQGAEAVNFRLSLLIYYIVAFFLCFIIIGFILIFLLFFFDLIFTIIAGIKASQGDRFRYPLIIRFIKPAIMIQNGKLNE